MGNYLGRSANAGDDDGDNLSKQIYHYPPKNGEPYFGTRFLMGSEKFELSQPECFLFGENTDLNYLDSKPVQFPFGSTQNTEPLRPLNCLINIRRDSVRFSRPLKHPQAVAECNCDVQNDNEVIGNGHVNVAVERDNDTSSSSRASSSDSCSTVDDTPPCRIEFTIDADVPCECRVHYLAATGKTTEHSLSDRRFSVSHAQHTSAAVACGVGANQRIECDELVFDETMLTSALSPPPAVSQALYPVIIEVHTLAAGRCQQTQLTLCTMSMSADGNGYVLKALKQKLIIDDVCYLLQEVYGIENKHVGTSGASVESVVAAASAHAEQQEVPEESDEAGVVVPAAASVANDNNDNSMDCVICMCELRDTIILPCRHLCLCQTCAETLRYKLKNCPICRSPFRALLQLRTLRKIRSHVSSAPSLTQILNLTNTQPTPVEAHATSDTHDVDKTKPRAPPTQQHATKSFLQTRYDSVPLVEALNGQIDQTKTVLTPLPNVSTAPTLMPKARSTHATPWPIATGGSRRHAGANPQRAVKRVVNTAIQPVFGGDGTTILNEVVKTREESVASMHIVDDNASDEQAPSALTAGTDHVTSIDSSTSRSHESQNSANALLPSTESTTVECEIVPAVTAVHETEC